MSFDFSSTISNYFEKELEARDRTIADLKDTIEDLKFQIIDLKGVIEDLKNQNSDLKSKIYDLYIKLLANLLHKYAYSQ
jgi:chaperonin cofactor prefoldin